MTPYANVRNIFKAIVAALGLLLAINIKSKRDKKVKEEYGDSKVKSMFSQARKLKEEIADLKDDTKVVDDIDNASKEAKKELTSKGDIKHLKDLRTAAKGENKELKYKIKAKQTEVENLYQSMLSYCEDHGYDEICEKIKKAKSEYLSSELAESFEDDELIEKVNSLRLRVFEACESGMISDDEKYVMLDYLNIENYE